MNPATPQETARFFAGTHPLYRRRVKYSHYFTVYYGLKHNFFTVTCRELGTVVLESGTYAKNDETALRESAAAIVAEFDNRPYFVDCD